jgi:hypothetical protein
MIHDKHRVEAIRARMNQQLQLIDSLKRRVVQGSLDALDVARDQTEDIETFFLAELARNDRTPAEEAFWLSGAERMLQTLASYLNKTKQPFDQYGDCGIQIVNAG